MISAASAQAQRDAAKVLADSGVLWPPTNVDLIARRFGLKLETVRLPDDTAGALVLEPWRTPRILLNRSHPKTRRRFTSAHEVGHFMRLDHDGTDSYSHVVYRNAISRRGTDPEEIYANEFAASLLIPKQSVVAWCEEGLDPWEMALKAEVSKDAVIQRLRNLGLA
jgi:Zn-dependent peptidase ImmA (M78 family)